MQVFALSKSHSYLTLFFPVGYIDAYLLAALRLAPGSRLWTRDKRLLAAATRLGLMEKPSALSESSLPCQNGATAAAFQR